MIDNTCMSDSVLFQMQEDIYARQQQLLEPDALPVDQFTNYVWSFYAPDATLYPIKGLSYQQCQAVCHALSLTDEYVGDTFDRERVRDIVCELYNLRVS